MHTETSLLTYLKCPLNYQIILNITAEVKVKKREKKSLEAFL